MDFKTTEPLLIRADAGGMIGTGHVMRMLGLAQAYRRRGGKTVFICAQLPETLEHRLIQEDCQVIRISAVPGSKEDARETLKVVQETGDRGQETGVREQGAGGRSQEPGGEAAQAPSSISQPATITPEKEDILYPISSPEGASSNDQWLVVDGYHFDYDYQKRIKEASLRLMCVDDHGYSDRWHCDAILNQNLDAERRIEYQSVFPDTRILAGSMFCLLREEFLKAKAKQSEWGKIECLLVTLGGSDPENATEATLGLLNRACTRPLKIRVLAGADNPHLERLRAFESQHQIEVVQNATNMPEQYAWADGIISAGGSTCWEWLYLGLPGAVVTIAENQLPIVKALTEDRRAALPLGWFNEFDVSNANLAAWLQKPDSIVEPKKAMELIDGYGTDRIAGFISGSKFMIRQAISEDCDLYFNWANDPMVRRNAFSTDEISRESHVRWFANRLNDLNSHLLVVVSSSGIPVGQVRFDFDDNSQTWIVDISIDGKYRSSGMGKASLTEALHWMEQHHASPFSIQANVLSQNDASKKLFLGMGFKPLVTDDDFASYSIIV